MASNMKAVKLRIRSVQSTMQITKAMELVASSKLRKAKERAETARPYFTELHDTLRDIANGNTDFTSIYTKSSENDKVCYVVIGGDRGLAGGYNANLVRMLSQRTKGTEYVTLPIGKKPVEYFRRQGVPILTGQFAEIAHVSVSDCFTMANLLCAEFRKGSFGHVSLCYTTFISMLSQRPDIFSVLPLADLSTREDPENIDQIRELILYEPSAAEVFDDIVPEYLAGLIYGAVCESVASELAARRMAMDSATKNAQEMIDTLQLHYNRARQASITQEITEIVAGAEGV